MNNNQNRTHWNLRDTALVILERKHMSLNVSIRKYEKLNINKHVSIPWTFLKCSMIYLMNNLMMTEDFITLFTSFSLVQILYKPGWILVDSLRNISIPLLILSIQRNYHDLGKGVSISYTVCRQACCHKSSSNWTPKWQILGIHTEPVSFPKRISQT